MQTVCSFNIQPTCHEHVNFYTAVTAESASPAHFVYVTSDKAKPLRDFVSICRPVCENHSMNLDSRNYYWANNQKLWLNILSDSFWFLVFQSDTNPNATKPLSHMDPSEPEP